MSGYDDEAPDPSEERIVVTRRKDASVTQRRALAVFLGAALLGMLFAAESTSDFIQHLDRQVHAIHCSFVPGAGSEVGESGCRTVMMSPYSSFFRESLWGGIPVSLWALAVFAFLAYRALVLVLAKGADKLHARFLLIASGLPALMTLIYAYLSMVKVGATCKVCVGIYLTSAVCLVSAFFVDKEADGPKVSDVDRPKLLTWAAEGVGFVVALTIVFLLFTPGSDAKKAGNGCGTLVRADDPAGVMVELSARTGGVPAIELLDPLCPACRAFGERLASTDLTSKLDLKAVLFPLDSTCNWMVTEALHPGACAVSEAMLCAKSSGESGLPISVLRWAFQNQEDLRALAAKDDGALRRKIESAFPQVKGCLGGYVVKNKLTKSLRWAVANAVPVLTPQLFVRDERMCDEDTDLGLEYTLAKMLRQPRGGRRADLRGER